MEEFFRSKNNGIRKSHDRGLRSINEDIELPKISENKETSDQSWVIQREKNLVNHM